MAITRLIARAASRSELRPSPLKRPTLFPVHLNHANSGEWELWTDEQVHKDGSMASGRSRNVRPGVKFRYSKPEAPSTGFTTTFRVPLWTR